MERVKNSHKSNINTMAGDYLLEITYLLGNIRKRNSGVVNGKNCIRSKITSDQSK